MHRLNFPYTKFTHPVSLTYDTQVHPDAQILTLIHPQSHSKYDFLHTYTYTHTTAICSQPGTHKSTYTQRDMFRHSVYIQKPDTHTVTGAISTNPHRGKHQLHTHKYTHNTLSDTGQCSYKQITYKPKHIRTFTIHTKLHSDIHICCC